MGFAGPLNGSLSRLMLRGVERRRAPFDAVVETGTEYRGESNNFPLAACRMSRLFSESEPAILGLWPKHDSGSRSNVHFLSRG